MKSTIKQINFLLTSLILIFIILGLVAAFQKQVVAFDSIFAAALLAVGMKVNSRINLGYIGAATLIFTTLLHPIGIMGLYSLKIIGLNADIVIHFLTAFFGCLTLLITFGKLNFRILSSIIFSIAIIMSIGSVVEVIEYWGYASFGRGPGIIGFGEGDNSMNFGPWENSSVDQTSNLLGALSAVSVYLITTRMKEALDD